MGKQNGRDILLTDPEGIANTLHTHFTEKIGITGTNEPTEKDWIRTDRENNKHLNGKYQALIKDFTMDEMINAISTMKYGTAAGPDKLGAGILKIIANHKKNACPAHDALGYSSNQFRPRRGSPNLQRIHWQSPLEKNGK